MSKEDNSSTEKKTLNSSEEKNHEAEDDSKKIDENLLLVYEEIFGDAAKSDYINDEVKKIGCTYDKGYIPQEIFVCKTCKDDTGKPSMICGACSLSCHLDHECFSIGFKRNFRCDCGNSKFFMECNFIKEKDYENEKNVYCHNFGNLMCYCNKEMPRGEGAVHQCLICEDYIHKECLNIYKLPKENSPEDYLSIEIICRNCVPKLSFIFDNYDIIKFIYTKEEDFKREELSLSSISKRKNSEVIKKSLEECKRNQKMKEQNKTLFEELIKNKNEIAVDGSEMETMLCKCKDCLKEYKEKNLDFLGELFYSEWNNRIMIEDQLDMNYTEDIKIKYLTMQAETDITKVPAFKELPMEEQLAYSYIFQKFNTELGKYIPKVTENGKIKLTKEMIQKFSSEFQNRLEQEIEKEKEGK
ncbi:MAG: hypothetical protein MJ252_14640 [archaeon]|nr:hypothetical protein [archaeon]